MINVIIVFAVGSYRYEEALGLSTSARGLGASYIVFTNPNVNIKRLKIAIGKLNRKFGGKFEVKHLSNPKKLISDHKYYIYKKVYLTSDGKGIKKNIRSLRNYKNILIIVSNKIYLYFKKYSDFNISVSDQPISVISSLTLFLYLFYEGREASLSFPKR